jgi:WhiB family redox-sensing transcriptional regulator
VNQQTTSHWISRASCRSEDPDLWFPTSYIDTLGAAQVEEAKAWCAECPVRIACLEAEMAVEGSRSAYYRNGIRGGLTPDERANLYQRRKRARERAAQAGMGVAA